MKKATKKEQLSKANAYKLAYSHANYKYINFRLRTDKDKALIDYLESFGGNRSNYLRKILEDDYNQKEEVIKDNGKKETYALVRGIFSKKSNSEEIIRKGSLNLVSSDFPSNFDLQKTMRDYYSNAEEKPDKYSAMYYEVRKIESDKDGKETGHYDTIMSISMTFEQAMR